MKKSLYEILCSEFDEGIGYSNALDLCIAIFCSTDWLYGVDVNTCTKEGIATAFGKISEQGIVQNFDLELAHSKGAVIVDYKNKIHWLEIINHAMRSNNFYDQEKFKEWWMSRSC